MYVGAFDIGGTKTIIALADETGRVYEKKQFSTDTRDCRTHIEKCCDLFREFLHRQGLDASRIGGIGVNLPGPVDREKGVLIRAVYAGWNNVPAKEWISEMLGIEHIVCENDVNSCAMGELKFGLGKQYGSFGWMTVSTGVGGAVVCGGKLIRGAHGYIDSDKREKHEMQFINGSKPIMVATTAFGMGINVPDIRLVLHFNLPLSTIDYYQQIGRAGRDGKKSHALLLYHPDDIELNRNILKKDDLSSKVQKWLSDRLGEMVSIAQSDQCLMQQLLAALGEDHPTTCRHCTNCQRARR